MDQLIFFSIPGLVFALTIIGIDPSIISSSSDQKLVALALLTPLIGYILHQTYRYFFEFTGGFGRNSRAVVKYIHEKLAPQESMSISKENAFLVWEIAIYDTKDFSGFLAHDAKSMHFTLAFWSTTFASIFGIIFTLLYFFFQNEPTDKFFTPLKISLAVIQILLAIVFYLRGRNVYKSINEQEVAFLYKNESVFIDCMKKISK